MYAIVDISGKQYKIEKDITINVDKLDSKADDDLIIDKILLYSNGDEILVGQPYLENVKVTAKVIGDIKGKKVRGVKFKKRKNYTRTMGHRQKYSKIRINDLRVS